MPVPTSVLAKGALAIDMMYGAAAQGFQQLRQVGDRVAIVHAAVQLETVDAGVDLDRKLARLAIKFPLGLDVPAGLEQGADDARQVARRQLQGGRGRTGVVFGRGAEAELAEAGGGLVRSGEILDRRGRGAGGYGRGTRAG